MWSNLLIALLILAAMLYLVVPVIVYQRFQFPFRQEARPAFPGSVPAEGWRFFDRVASALSDEGFVRSQPFFPPAVTGTIGVAMLLVNRRRGDSALAALLYAAKAGRLTLKVEYVEFLTLFDDGTAVLTSNSEALSSFPPTRGRDAVALPQLSSPSRLYAAHVKRAAQSGAPSRGRIVPEVGEEVRFGVEQVIDAVARQTGTGYMEERAGAYRPTLYGAVAMVWKELPPLKQVRWLLHRRRAARVLRELRLDG